MTAAEDPVVPEHDPFRFGAIAQVVPTTDAQREVLAAAALGDLANCAYNEAVSIRLTGALDATLVERALAALVDRHDALRASFTPQLDAMCIRAEVAVPLQRSDLTALEPKARELAVQAARRECVSTPFALVQGPLLRAHWLQLGADSAELLLVAHHAVCDGWSYHVLLRDLEQLCGASGGAPATPAPSFAEFAVERAAGAGRAHGGYWLRKFSTTPPPLDLPLDRPRGPQRAFAAERVERLLSPQVRLPALASALRVSPVTVVVAGVAALLHRLTGNEDLVLGMPVARQALEDRGGLVGHCVQLLPVRLGVDGDTPFAALAAAAQKEVLDATEHYDFTFGSLVQALRRSGDAGRVPLIPVLVNIDQPAEELQIGAARGAVATVPRVAESFEVFLNVVPQAGGFLLEATFQSELFDAASVSTWLAALEQLLIGAAAAPQAAIGSLALQSAEDVEQGAVGAAVPLRFTHWLQALQQVVASSPDAAAVRDDQGVLSYAALWQRITALAADLRRRGVGRGDVVGLCVGRSRSLVVAMAAVHACGAAHLPLDPSFPIARLRQLREDSGAALVVVDAEGAALGLGAECLDLDAVAADRATGEAMPEAPPNGDDAAYLIYTSGSTGVPKGVKVSHRSLANLLAGVAVAPGFSAADTLLAVTTMSFDISLLELLLPLTVGGCVAVAPRAEVEDPQKLAALLLRHRATVMQATPATWRMLVDDGWSGAADLVAFCGGERLPVELARSLLPRVRALWNLYGPTETTVWSTVAQVLDADAAPGIGRPLQNSSVFVLDGRGGVLPRGVPGELCIGGEGVAIGYHEREELTAERFFVHPILGRLYRTGDRGRVRPDGTLECFGRVDQQVKVRGYRIELGEIEAALRSCADVVEAVVVVQGDDAQAARLVGFVVTSSGALPDGWREQLQRTLPVYMVPHQLALLAALPRLPNGKLDRRALPTLTATTQDAASFVEPATPEERLVATEMAAVLGVERVGATEDFFAAGGHSLLAAQLVVRLNRASAGDLTMRAVFEAPTPRALAARLGTETGDRLPRVVRRARRDVAPATLVQERMWHLEQMATGRNGYNLPSAHRLRGPLDEAVLLAALQEIVNRQAALRTTFERRDGAVWQVVHEHLRLQCPPLEDLSELPPAERQRRLEARLDELAAESFDLGRLPLFRLQLFRLAADEHVFFFMPHHVIWDGWSFDLLYQEIDALYAAFAAGQPSPLPALTIEMGDIAQWQRDRQASPAAAQRVRIVRERLERFGPVRPLPVDHGRRPGMSGRGACEWLNLSADVARALHEFAGARGLTLFHTSLAIYAVLLHEYSQQSRVLLATPVRGRNTPEQEAVMGCCNTLVPVPLDVGAQASFDSLARAVRATVLEGLATADVTLEQLGGAGARRGSVLYQALFSFQDVRGRRTCWGPLEHEMIPLFQRGATEDLGLWFVERENGLDGVLTYNADTLDGATVRRLRDRFTELASALVAAPQESFVGLLHEVAAVAAESEPQSEPEPDRSAPAVTEPAADAPAAPLPQAEDFELILTRIWREILGVPEVGLHDDFFELGGNSLTAIRCVDRFEAATGLMIDLGEVFRSPTVAQLAASLASRSQRSGPMLIPLQERGDEPPLFCLLGIQIYRHLAHGLGERQPVFGVYVPEEQGMVEGLPGSRSSSVSIDRLADAYVEVIRSSHPSGPYRLAGLSFGGVVALEVARRLVALGDAVDRVVLLDTILPQSFRRRWWHVPARSWLRSLRAAARSFAGLVTRRNGSEDSAGRPRHDHAFRSVQAAMQREVLRWQASFVPPPCPVLLLRARDNWWGRGYVALPDYGWGGIIGPSLQVQSIPGDHLGILLTPDLGDLARAVTAFLA
ncbi:MAG: amino acid adenylation domain-containing protein [Planctomycetes bacterium]|nr:amino acid adenylation domain-containing protein [Planctomycetota bacterium]MCB9885399.1 amino acid adenylation domain-containing protein [Planctomycetota bacterium]